MSDQTPPEDIGLALDILDADRMLKWAENIEAFGPDLTNWANTAYVAQTLHALSEHIRESVRDSLTLRDQVATLTARCEALTAERNQLNADAEWRDRWHTRLGRLHQSEGRFYEGIEAKLSRCQHLEQAIQRYVESEAFDALAYRYRTSPSEDAGSVVNAFDALKDGILAAVRLSQPQTDENRVSFAAGYTAALDDALKGTR